MSDKLLEAKYGSVDRPLKIGDIEIPCYVLEDGTRILTQYGFYRAIGRSGKPAKGRGSGFDKLAPFLDLDNLKPYINSELAHSTKPIQFKPPKRAVAWGYRAEILPKVCEVYIKARDDGNLLKSQKKFADVCEIIMKGLSQVGIIALVDEVTGYQKFRAQLALTEILEKFIAKELRPWAKTFPDEFYENLFRLKGWKYDPGSVKRPMLIGKLTNDLIYDRLAPGVLDELKKITPKDSKGRLKQHYHRRLTEDIGHPRLREHIAAVMALQRTVLRDGWRKFYSLMNRALPKRNVTIEIGFDNDDEE